MCVHILECYRFSSRSHAQRFIAESVVQMSREGIWLEDGVRAELWLLGPLVGYGAGTHREDHGEPEDITELLPTYSLAAFFWGWQCRCHIYLYFSCAKDAMTCPLLWTTYSCLLLWTFLPLSRFPLPSLHASPDLGFWVLII